MSAARTTDGLAPVSSDVAADGGGRERRGRPSPAGAPGRAGRTAAATRAATMAMFQPEMATTWVRPAVAKASLISGAIDARTPSRIPAPSAASGSGTRSFRPPSSVDAARRRASAAGPLASPTHLRRLGRARSRRCPGAPGTRGTRSRRSPRPARCSSVTRSRSPAAGVDPARQPDEQPIAERRGPCHRSRLTRSPRTSWSRSSRGRGSSTTVPTSSCSSPSTRRRDRGRRRSPTGSAASLAPGADGRKADSATPTTQPRPRTGSASPMPATPDRRRAAAAAASVDRVGGQDAGGDARRGRRAGRSARRRHRSARGRDALDVLQLAAVDHAALDRVLERGERLLLARGDDLLDGHRRRSPAAPRAPRASPCSG